MMNSYGESISKYRGKIIDVYFEMTGEPENTVNVQGIIFAKIRFTFSLPDPTIFSSTRMFYIM